MCCRPSVHEAWRVSFNRTRSDCTIWMNMMWTTKWVVCGRWWERESECGILCVCRVHGAQMVFEFSGNVVAGGECDNEKKLASVVFNVMLWMLMRKYVVRTSHRLLWTRTGCLLLADCCWLAGWLSGVLYRVCSSCLQHISFGGRRPAPPSAQSLLPTVCLCVCVLHFSRHQAHTMSTENIICYF